MAKVDTLFLDIGGVLLTNGWDHNERKKAAEKFGLNWDDFERRHKEYYDLHETDKISLDEYLTKVVFWEKRSFTRDQFKDFMYAQSQPYTDMLKLIPELKKQFNLTIAFVSNEGRGLAEYRIKKFNFKSFADYFFISCFVNCQKPDPRIYKMALDISQKNLDQIVYIDDRLNLVEAAQKLGIPSFQHISYEATKAKLLSLLEGKTQDSLFEKVKG